MCITVAQLFNNRRSTPRDPCRRLKPMPAMPNSFIVRACTILQNIYVPSRKQSPSPPVPARFIISPRVARRHIVCILSSIYGLVLYYSRASVLKSRSLRAPFCRRSGHILLVYNNNVHWFRAYAITDQTHARAYIRTERSTV